MEHRKNRIWEQIGKVDNRNGVRIGRKDKIIKNLQQMSLGSNGTTFISPTIGAPVHLRE